jgi:choline-sulfatase
MSIRTRNEVVKKKKHIVYILSDQHNPEIMGNAGDPYVRTPNIDRLYAEGTSLEHCYCGSPLCVPSRTALLTGKLPSRTGIWNNMQCLPTHVPTFANSLTANGYETVLSGRMHFVGWDQRHGFEKRFVGDITPSFIGEDNEEEIYGSFKRSSGQNTVSVKKSGAGDSAVLHFDRDVVDAACTYLQERTDDRPLFLTVGLYGPHCPYIAPKELYDHYYRVLPEIPFWDKEKKDAMHPAIRAWYGNRKLESVTREDVRRIRAAYYAMVELLDGYVGQVVETVRKTIGLEDTVIIYGSDHGDNIGTHGMFWKTNFYDAAARVPMVFVNRELFKAGATVGGVTSLLDLAPTILEATGSIQLGSYDGQDILENLKEGKPVSEDRMVFSLCSDIKGDNPSAMVRHRQYKLVVYAGYEDCQLFDLEKDPRELQDLSADPSLQPLVQRMRSALAQVWDEDRALEQLKQSKMDFSLMKTWFDTVRPPLVEEWRGDPNDNYLEEREDT